MLEADHVARSSAPPALATGFRNALISLSRYRRLTILMRGRASSSGNVSKRNGARGIFFLQNCFYIFFSSFYSHDLYYSHFCLFLNFSLQTRGEAWIVEVKASRPWWKHAEVDSGSQWEGKKKTHGTTVNGRYTQRHEWKCQRCQWFIFLCTKEMCRQKEMNNTCW